MIPKDARTWIERQRDEFEPAHPFVRFGVHFELDLSADTTTWPAVELQPEAIYEARFRAAERAFGQS